jgi:hypothetical protein
MFCPECKVEYRLGFTECSDCHVALVAELPTEVEPGTPNPANMRVIARPSTDAACVSVCLTLREAGIPYQVQQERLWRAAGMDIAWKFDVFVEVDRYEDAKRVLELPFGADEEGELPNEEELQATMELPAEDFAGGEGGLQPPEDWDPENWFPEDATTEVWSGKDDKIADIIEMSLRENFIHSRRDGEPREDQKIFVLPEDEPRASEIIREIVNARSPADQMF